MVVGRDELCVLMDHQDILTDVLGILLRMLSESLDVLVDVLDLLMVIALVFNITSRDIGGQAKSGECTAGRNSDKRCQ